MVARSRLGAHTVLQARVHGQPRALLLHRGRPSARQLPAHDEGHPGVGGRADAAGGPRRCRRKHGDRHGRPQLPLCQLLQAPEEARAAGRRVLRAGRAGSCGVVHNEEARQEEDEEAGRFIVAGAAPICHRFPWHHIRWQLGAALATRRLRLRLAAGLRHPRWHRKVGRRRRGALGAVHGGGGGDAAPGRVGLAAAGVPRADWPQRPRVPFPRPRRDGSGVRLRGQRLLLRFPGRLPG
mmetsp:Transcript_19362/g.55131  ORF Transcript_19362/g.55131 Transcript_19362/m.55131 type:complete len:238 (-) Transcript_19362:47-760(-)